MNTTKQISDAWKRKLVEFYTSEEFTPEALHRKAVLVARLHQINLEELSQQVPVLQNTLPYIQVSA